MPLFIVDKIIHWDDLYAVIFKPLLIAQCSTVCSSSFWKSTCYHYLNERRKNFPFILVFPISWTHIWFHLLLYSAIMLILCHNVRRVRQEKEEKAHFSFTFFFCLAFSVAPSVPWCSIPNKYSSLVTADVCSRQPNTVFI